MKRTGAVIDNDKLEKILSHVQKPGRYSGGELYSVVKDLKNVDVRFAFCFPDIYEIGMSHLGIKILYSALNAMDEVWCERVFAPWDDMEKEMRQNDMPIYTLESRTPLKEFDFVGFTMLYELSYTNVLNVLDLAGIPLYAHERGEDEPIVIIGGPCTCNPEPLADFVDIMSLGEGEEALPELMKLYEECKAAGLTKKEFLHKAATELKGFYVPSLYDVSYNDDGTVKSIVPTGGAPAVITKRIIKDLNTAHYPDRFIVPFVEVVHDRAVEEVFRGCIRGCRFCQAGFIYRPVREKSAETVNRQARSLCDKCGFEELSLSSLSTSDYTELKELLNEMLEWTENDSVSVSLPSLRVDNFSKELLEKIQKVRKSSLTFAPEAGTQRLRDVINKNVTEDEVIRTAKIAFSGGMTSVKLYFMLGLPTETDEDLKGIADLAQKVVDTFYSMPDKPKGKGVNVSVSVSTFVPKPDTPFQWEPQIDFEEIKRRQAYLVSCVRSKKISLSWHDADISFLEGVLARGDRRLSAVIERAYKKGCHLDSWGEFFHLDKWLEAFDECGIDPHFYNNRKRDFDEIMPWSHIDYGISQSFLKRENELAHKEITTPNCREKCAGCGAARLSPEACGL